MTNTNTVTTGIEYDSHGHPTSESLHAIAEWSAGLISSMPIETNDQLAYRRRMMDHVAAVRSGAEAREAYGQGVSKSVDIERRRALSHGLESAKGLLSILGTPSL